MKIRYLVLLCLLVLSETFYASPKVYYVSTKRGNDSYTGESLNKSWKSIEYAIKRINEISCQTSNDVLLLVDKGDYDINSEMVIRGGKNGLTIKAIKPGSVIIHGDYKIRNLSGDGKVKQAKLNNVDMGVAVGYYNRLDFYCNNSRQPLSGWPNVESLKIKKPLGTTVLSKGLYKEPIFEYDERHIDSFANIDDIYVHGFWANDWFDEYGKVKKIDKSDKSVTLGKDIQYGFRRGMPYRFLNLFSELDSVGEYYVDRKDSMLYWYSPSDYKPNSDELTITRFKAMQMLTISNSENVVIDGISFVGGRQSCMLVDNCKEIQIKDCSISRFGDTGINIKKSWDVTIEGCLLESLGTWGMNISSGDRFTLSPGNITIRNSIFKGISNYRDTYRQCINFNGCGALITHNRFIDHPSSALRINANDVIIEYNVFEDIAKKSGDQGALDMYNDFSYRGIVIRYNYWKNINSKSNVAAVRFDDQISGQQVNGNIFENCGNTYFGAVQIHGGNYNNIYNNVFIDCPCAVSFDKYNKTDFVAALEKDTKDKYLGLFNSELYKKKYPELNHPLDEGVNKNFIHDNVIINAKEPIRRGGVENEINDNKTDSLSYKYMHNIPRILKKYGMNNIPFKRIGVKRNIYERQN